MTKERFSRQSFLGERSQDIIDNCRIGILGLGGGGSHIVQQFAHIGIRNYVIYDPDIVETSNLNRLVGATERDAKDGIPKIEIAKRIIVGLHEKAKIDAYRSRWQDNPEPLKQCDIVFGCVDSFAERHQIEVTCRRYLIPYIDIGMDVHTSMDGNTFGMAGQVIVSIPGGPCMSCIGFLTENRLAQEAMKYGAAGVRPQVVWANGVLASTAVGFAMDILTGWAQVSPRVAYLSYRGNDGTVGPHVRLQYPKQQSCSHFSLKDIGDPVFTHL